MMQFKRYRIYERQYLGWVLLLSLCSSSASAQAVFPGNEEECRRMVGEAKSKFMALLTERQRGGNSVTKEELKEASRDYIVTSQQCFEMLYGRSPFEGWIIDEEPVLPPIAEGSVPMGGATPQFITYGTKWGAGSPFSAGLDARGPALPGGEVTYSFMPSGVSLTGDPKQTSDSIAVSEFAGCADTPNGALRKEIKAAFAAWELVADITFREVADSGDAFDAPGAAGHMRICYHSFSDSTLGHAYYPPSSGTETTSSAPGDIHFNSSVPWECDPGQDVTNGVDLGIVAIHEIGHAIGLRHEGGDGSITDPNPESAVMNTPYDPSIGMPLADDIEGAESIYGSPLLDRTFWGNVGIGTESPSERLHVSGNVTVSGSVDAASVAVAGAVSSGTAFTIGGLQVLRTPDTNSFFGKYTGTNNTGVANTAIGNRALSTNNTGGRNTAVGDEALRNNSSGSANTAVGEDALNSNTTGFDNTAVGEDALATNQTGSQNTAIGHESLKASLGFSNSSLGHHALFSNTLGSRSTGIGESSLLNNTEGSDNTAVGKDSGLSNTSENNNSFFGAYSNGAGSITNATAIGYRSQVSQSNSLVLGSIAGLNGAPADSSVGIGTNVPASPLHVKRSDGTARILIEDSGGVPTVTTLHMKNNGRVQTLYENTADGVAWQLSQHLTGFIISRVGTGGSEFRIYDDGSVEMGPGGTQNFFLKTSGDLDISGELTATAVNSVSDRNRKTDFREIDGTAILRKVAALPISSWRYKEDGPETRHLGPVAQDFRQAFGLGSDDRHINALDVSGVALAAIQGLRRELEKRDEEIARLREQINEIRSLMEEYRPRDTETD